MNGKALYSGRWYSVANINFDTGFISIRNDGSNSLGLTVGSTLTVSFNQVSDVKTNGIAVWD